MPNIFISYRSSDRPWAERFYTELRYRFPTIKVFWDRDPASIPPGQPARGFFEKGAKDTTHLIVFWSTAARESNEVGPEVQAFLQNRESNPTSATGAKRTLFYVPLEQGVEYGGLVDYQGFPDFQTAYAPDAPNRGTSALAAGASADAWRRMIGIIGNSVLGSEASQPVALALFVMTKATVNYVDPFFDMKQAGAPTLKEFLESIGLTLDQAKARFGDTAFSWQPFGDGRTIIDLAENVRETANRNIGSAYRFHWRPIDFVEELINCANYSASRRLLDSLSDGPAVVVTDPISLFNPVVNKMFKLLSEYAKKPQSVILSITPNQLLAEDRLFDTLLSNGSPVLDSHLYPPIPAVETFALCGVNIQHAVDAERLIKAGLGYYYLQKKKSDAKSFVSSGL